MPLRYIYSGCFTIFFVLLVFLAGCGSGGGDGQAVQTYVVTGRVVDSNGTGIDGIKVTILSTGKPVAKTVPAVVGSNETTTANSGYYTFEVGKGSYQISSNDPTYGFIPVSVTVTGNSTPEIPPATTFKLFTIQGTITNISAGTPFSGVSLLLYPATVTIKDVGGGLSGGEVARGTNPVTTATTGYNGVYSISSLKSGTYVLTPSYTGFVFNPAQTAAITITDNGSVYVYDKDRTGNDIRVEKINGTGQSIIYNSILTMAANVLTLDFTASIPGGTEADY